MCEGLGRLSRAAGFVLTFVGIWAGSADAQKIGGVLKVLQRENPPSLSILEEATTSSTWPVAPLYNNLVTYNPAHAVESTDDLTGELAESWAWSRDGRRLTFELRRGVKWHDGAPFTSADVKYTFDLVRGVLPDRKLRTNPRKLWYGNVAGIVANGDGEVVFVLKRPQPGFLSVLASGFAVIYPAHIDPAELRTRSVRTGPFRLKQLIPDERIEEVRNPDYFIPGRPYLDGITYLIIKDRSAHMSALASRQLDVFAPQEASAGMRDQIKTLAPQIVVKVVAQSANYNILINTKRPPFDNLKVRQAVNYALDRQAFLTTMHGGAVPGGTLTPPPYGHWGLTPHELAKLPGWGDPQKDKAQARRLLAQAGYGQSNPLVVTITTRSTTIYEDMAAWAVSQLREAGIVATLEEVDTTVWYSKLNRRDYTLGANVNGSAVDEPDTVFLENFSCGSVRNYTDFCDPALDEQMRRVGETRSPKQRLALAQEIDRRLQIEGARTLLGHAIDFAMYWPDVKGYVPQHNAFNYGRMQEVWLDR